MTSVGHTLKSYHVFVDVQNPHRGIDTFREPGDTVSKHVHYNCLGPDLFITKDL